MQALVDVILPVFLVIAAGYLARVTRVMSDAGIDGLMRFAQNVAIPALLMGQIARLDLGAAYDIGLLVSFFAGAASGFALGFGGAHWALGRPLPDSVAIGFAAMFSNTLLLGLPITERAYGAGALAGNYVIISVHSPLLYTVGILAMELARARGGGGHPLLVLPSALRGILSQPLVLGILAGFALNLTGTTIPGAAGQALDLLTRAALPVALFGLGGVLWRYRPAGDARAIALVIAAALVVHPAVTWLLATQVYDLPAAALRSAVVTAAMAPGVNAYLFAHLYGVGQRIAASAVLIGTGLTVLTAWGWLHILG